MSPLFLSSSLRLNHQHCRGVDRKRGGRRSCSWYWLVPVDVSRSAGPLPPDAGPPPLPPLFLYFSWPRPMASPTIPALCRSRCGV